MQRQNEASATDVQSVPSHACWPPDAESPVDGLCDSRREVFRVATEAVTDGWSVRGVDRAGNKVEAPLADVLAP